MQPGMWTPTFIAVFDSIALAQNKYVATLFNGDDYFLARVLRAMQFQWSSSAVTGIPTSLELRKLTARTVGTEVTPLAMDSRDECPTTIKASHNDSSVTELSGGLIRKWWASSEEFVVGSTTLTANTIGTMDWFGENSHVFWSPHPAGKPITLRKNEGVSVKCTDAGATGAMSFLIEFALERVN